MYAEDKTCVNCKYTGIMIGVPVCNHKGHCLNYDYFQERETKESKYRKALESIVNAPPFMNKTGQQYANYFMNIAKEALKEINA